MLTADQLDWLRYRREAEAARADGQADDDQLAFLGALARGERPDVPCVDEPRIAVSKFANRRDNTPVRIAGTWDELVHGLRNPRSCSCSLAGCVRSECPHKDGPAWSPATWPDGERRARDTVGEVHALVADLDHLADDAALEAALAGVGGLRVVVHGSHSDRPGDRCARVVVALSRPVLARWWSGFWREAMARLGLPADEATKDPSRLYYLPSRPGDAVDDIEDGTGYLFASQEGAPLDVDAILASLPPPEDVARAPVEIPEFASAPTAIAMAAAAQVLGNAWPHRGRHLAHLALAGALGRKGWPAELIADFSTRIAEIQECGNGDYWRRHKNASDTLNKLHAGDADVTGWPEVARHVGDEAVSRAQELLGLKPPRDLWPALVSMSGRAPRQQGEREERTSKNTDAERFEERAHSHDEIRSFLRRANTDKLDSGPRPCGWNVMTVLRYANEFRGRLRWNVITRDIEVTDGPFVHAQRTGTLDTAIRNWLESEFNLHVSREEVGQQLLLLAHDAEYDPVRGYLAALVWDRQARIDRWLSTYCGVDDCDYMRKVAARWLISGAARGLDPGCKVDTVLILKGPQGYRKSTVFDVLGGEWFSDSPLDLANKDARITSASTWIIELAELAALGQRGLEQHKAFLAGRRDKIRPPYGRADVTFDRHCVFAGTTNEAEFLVDETGNRRYWVAEVKRHADIELLRRDRDQLWAEAVARYRGGERWWFDAAEQVVADKANLEHAVEDPWVDKILSWAETRAKAPRKEGEEFMFKLADVAEHALGIRVEALDWKKRQITSALRRAGFKSRAAGEKRDRWWFRADER